jgi:aminopeptidase
MMKDERIEKLAEILVNYSIKVKKGSIIKLSFGMEAYPLALSCYKKIIKKGAFPITNVIVPGFAYNYYNLSTEEQLKKFPKITEFEAKNIDGSISIGAEYNTKEFSSVNPKKIAIRSQVIKPISEIYLKKDNWVGCEYPTHSLAQEAEMSLEEIEDFIYSATNIDWKKEEKKQLIIKKILDKGNNVKITSKDTNISFSIKGRQGIMCCGHRNMPDGEVFIAPIENTVEGFIRYSYPAIKSGKEVEDVYLEFSKGKIIRATAKKNEDFLKAMINTDKGSSYIGEFGIGVNYGIKRFIKNILFDEKIGGSIHLALGMAYKEGGGVNESALHWDMIKDLRQGGEIYIDEKLIQKNGIFKFKY